GLSRSCAKPALDIVLKYLLEFFSDVGAAQHQRLPAVDEDRRCRGFAGAWQGNSNIRVLGFAWAVHDAAHDRKVQGLDARITRFPIRHPVPDHVLDVAGKL